MDVPGFAQTDEDPVLFVNDSNAYDKSWLGFELGKELKIVLEDFVGVGVIKVRRLLVWLSGFGLMAEFEIEINHVPQQLRSTFLMFGLKFIKNSYRFCW